LGNAEYDEPTPGEREPHVVNDLLINLLASLVAATLAWIAQRLLRYRRMVRKQAFFGLDTGSGCVLTVPRHASSPNEQSVHRRDVAAVVELAAVAKECGASVELASDDEVPTGLGRLTEFSVGGPTANARTAAHLRSMLPGVVYEPAPPADVMAPFSVGATTYRRTKGSVEYVLLARVFGPAGGHPVFVISGQTARTNFAAARFLAINHRRLAKMYGTRRRFCYVLRVKESEFYGPDYAEIAADCTADAFTARAVPSTPAPQPAPDPAPQP
jgi:hypothetical protein